jgi:hypothetical protein
LPVQGLAEYSEVVSCGRGCEVGQQLILRFAQDDSGGELRMIAAPSLNALQDSCVSELAASPRARQY